MVQPWQRWLNHPAVQMLIVVLFGGFIVWHGRLAASGAWDTQALVAAGVGFAAGVVVFVVGYAVRSPEKVARWMAGLEERSEAAKWAEAGLVIGLLLLSHLFIGRRDAYILGAVVVGLLHVPVAAWTWRRAEELRRKANDREGQT